MNSEVFTTAKSPNDAFSVVKRHMIVMGKKTTYNMWQKEIKHVEGCNCLWWWGYNRVSGQRKRTVNSIIRRIKQYRSPEKSTSGKGKEKSKGSEAGTKKCIHLELGWK